MSVPDLSRGSDLCLANLEGTTYTANAAPRPKSGPSLRGSDRALRAARPRFGPLVLSLANNHAMDFGSDGLKATMAVCRDLGLEVVGAGENLEEARAPLILDVKGTRLGILARCETQFGGAGRTRAGVANIDTSLWHQVHRLAREVDAVVVTIHGGPELSPWPSPTWQGLLRSLVDAGAAIVHGHHAHVPQGYETYNGGAIIYGPGNFLIDPEVWGDDPHHPHALWSLAAECSLEQGSVTISARTLVTERSSSELTVRFAGNGEFRTHAGYLAQCNRPLSDPALLEALWQETAVRMYELFYAEWLGHPSPRSSDVQLRAALASCRSAAGRLLRGRRAMAPEEKLLQHYHLFSCEAHRDGLSTALGVLSGELEDLRSDETRSQANALMPWSAPEFSEMHWPGPGRRFERVEESQ